MWILKSKAHTLASMSLLSLTAVAAPMRLYRVAQLDEAPRWHRQHSSGENEELGVQEWSADAGEIEHGYDNDGHRQIQH